MSNQLTIEVYNNIASGAPPIQVIETEISSSSIFVQALEDVPPINVQVYESTTSGTFPIQVIESEFTGVPIFVEVQEDYAPVQSVNGKIGFVTLTAADLGISGVELSPYATISGLSATGQNLDNKINSLSGYVEEENILVFTAELPSGQETVFLTYPFSLGTSPSSITCSFQNTIDNVIYNYIIGQITQSGFHANFSDILSNSGYLLKVNVKK